MNLNCIALGLTILIAFPLTYVDGRCCPGDVWQNCGSYCCGCGRCNIFCCNCADGCNRMYWSSDYPASLWSTSCNHKKQETLNSFKNASLEAGILFNSVDIDGSNAITMREANNYLKSKKEFKRSTLFSFNNGLKIMDINNDGVISPEEFDESLRV